MNQFHLMALTIICGGFFALAPNATAGGMCSKQHCSDNSERINRDCQAAGLAGEKFYIETPSGFCFCNCSCFAKGIQVTQEGGDALVENIKMGQTLNTPAGEIEVTHVLYSPVEQAPAYRITLENGKSLVLSPNHPLITEGGIVAEARTLKTGMKLLDTKGLTIGIEAIEPISYTGTFYNYILDGKKASGTDRILFSEGIQSGDWQVQSYRNYLKANVGLRKLISEMKQ